MSQLPELGYLNDNIYWEHNVGKTCLVHRFANDMFLDKPSQPTIRENFVDEKIQNGQLLL